MSTLRKSMPPLPEHMRHLPIDDRGYPIPFFVKWYDGKPDFRVFDSDKFVRAVREGLCTICGRKLGRYKSFVGGPLMVTQMVSAEPPVHSSCAHFAVRTCPFLVFPKSKRRDANLPDELGQIGEKGDAMIEENPGVTAIWTCSRVALSSSRRTFQFLDLESLAWFTQGREATDFEVSTAIAASTERLLKAREEENRHEAR